MGRFRARELREDATLPELRRQLNEIQREIAADLGALGARGKVSSLQLDGPYAAGYGETVRISPPSGGFRLILPPVNLEQPNGVVRAIVEGSTGALSVEAVDTTVNGADTLTFLAGVGTAEFLLTPTGWYAFSASLVSVPIASLPSEVPFLLRTVMTAGTAGTADDVTIYDANAPFAFTIVDCWLQVSTAIAGHTAQLRTATGGGGSALSTALSMSATGTARNNDTASRSVAADGSVFVRRTDRGTAGTIIIHALRA